MENRTQEFLDECKDAGYERVTIYIADKRVPYSVKIKKQSNGGYWGYGTATNPFRVVCGWPEQTGEHPTLPGNGWPKMWGIVKNLKLNFGGGGSGDAHDIGLSQIHMLTEGYYDLKADLQIQQKGGKL